MSSSLRCVNYLPELLLLRLILLISPSATRQPGEPQIDNFA